MHLSDPDKIRRWWKLLWPAVLVLIVYGGTGFRWQRDRIAGVREQVDSKVNAIDALKERTRFQVNAAGPNASAPGQAIPTSTAALAPNAGGRRTDVQVVSGVMSIFQAHQVRCLTSEPKKLDSDNRDSPTGHRLSLIGSFTEVRAAMQAIENELPRACTTDLVMDRHDPAEPCRWELTLKLEGQAR